MGPCKASKGTNTKVTSAKGHFCAYPIAFLPKQSPAWSSLSCSPPMATDAWPVVTLVADKWGQH